MIKWLAVDGMILELQNGVTGVVSVVTPPSVNVKIGGKGVYSGDISIQVASATYNGFVVPNPVTLTIRPTNTKVKANDMFVIVEGDESNTMSATGNNPQGATSTVNVKVKVSSAGQSKVKVTG